MSNVGTIAIEQIIPSFQRSHSRDYVGRHHIKTEPPIITRAARRVAYEWTRPRPWTTAIARRFASGLSDRNANRLYDFLTGQTFHDIGGSIAATWHNLDRGAYARIPKTWRHRLETAARRRREQAQQQRDTEAWWTLRSADYPVLIPTQAMPTLERNPS